MDEKKSDVSRRTQSWRSAKNAVFDRSACPSSLTPPPARSLRLGLGDLKKKQKKGGEAGLRRSFPRWLQAIGSSSRNSLIRFNRKWDYAFSFFLFSFRFFFSVVFPFHPFSPFSVTYLFFRRILSKQGKDKYPTQLIIRFRKHEISICILSHFPITEYWHFRENDICFLRTHFFFIFQFSCFWYRTTVNISQTKQSLK